MQSVPVNQFGIAQHPPQAFGLPPEWRAPHSEATRHERNGRDGGRDRDRRGGHPSRTSTHQYRRSPSPSSTVSYNRPLRFSMTTDNGHTFGVFSNGHGNGQNWKADGSSSTGSSTLPVIPGLPAKPVQPALPVAAPSKTPLLERMSAPPPPGARSDPRSRVSYHDLDMVDGAEDIALQY